MNNASETPDCNKHPWNHWPYFSDMSFINSEYVNRKVKSKDAGFTFFHKKRHITYC